MYQLAWAGRSPPAEVVLPVDAEAERWAESFAPGFVLLAPTAGWGAKEWGAARFAQLAGELVSSGARVLVNAIPGASSPVSEEISKRSGAEIVRSDLPQMISLTRRAALVIGGGHRARCTWRLLLGCR